MNGSASPTPSTRFSRLCPVVSFEGVAEGRVTSEDLDTVKQEPPAVTPTAENVKFSFERYRCIFARGLKDRVRRGRDPRRRAHKPLFAPMYELAFIHGVGRRVDEPGLGPIAGYAFSAPYEDLRLKAQ